MKKIICFCIFSVAVLSCRAQGKTEDIIYVKGGYIVRGVIVEQEPSVYVKIRTADNVTYKYNFDQIDSIKGASGSVFINKEGTADHVDSLNHSSQKSSEGAKYLFIIEPDFGLYYGDGSGLLYGLQMVNGILVNPYFSAGLGIGWYDAHNRPTVPIFGDIRIYFSKSQSTPYLGVAARYAIPTTNDRQGGLYFNPTFGACQKIAKNVSFLFNFGYMLSNYQASYSYYGYPGLQYVGTDHYLIVKIGVLL